MSPKKKPEPKGEAPKPGPDPLRLKIDENEIGDAMARIVSAGKPEAPKKRRGKRARGSRRR